MTDTEVKCFTCFGSGVAGDVVTQKWCPMCKGNGYIILRLLNTERLEEIRDYVRNANVGSALISDLLIHIDAQSKMLEQQKGSDVE